MSEPRPRRTATAETDALGLRRFVNLNANLLRMIALMFSAAAFLRATPKDDGTAIMTLLCLTIGTATYLRMWLDVPRRYFILPGEGWTLGLTLTYYCMTILLVIAAMELGGGFVEQRTKYLGILLGAAFAITGAAAVTHRAGVELKLVNALAGVFGEGHRQRVASLLVVAFVVAIIIGSFAVGDALGSIINGALDAMGAPLPSPTP